MNHIPEKLDTCSHTAVLHVGHSTDQCKGDREQHGKSTLWHCTSIVNYPMKLKQLVHISVLLSGNFPTGLHTEPLSRGICWLNYCFLHL